MRISSSLHYLIAAAAASALLVGCNNGNLQPASNAALGSGIQQQMGGNVVRNSSNALSAIAPSNIGKIRKPGEPYPNWMRLKPYSGNGMAYVAEFGAKGVKGYHKPNTGNKAPFCIEPASVVNYTGTDSAGDLWVPNGGSNTTIEYLPKCGAPTGLQITDSDGQPSNVAFDSSSNVYILKITSPSGGCNVDEYPTGSTISSKTFNVPTSAFCLGVALDPHNNLYVSWVDHSNAGHVAKFVHGTGAYVLLPMTIGFAGALTFDGKKRMLLLDQSADVIDVYNPPYGSTADATITLKGSSPDCKLDRGRVHLYCADYDQSSIDVYNYDSASPGNTTYNYSWTNGLIPSLEVQSVSLDPPAPN